MEYTDEGSCVCPSPSVFCLRSRLRPVRTGHGRNHSNHEITLSQASYLVFVASGKLTEEDSPEKAYALLLDFGWLKGAGFPFWP